MLAVARLLAFGAAYRAETLARVAHHCGWRCRLHAAYRVEMQRGVVEHRGIEWRSVALL